MKLCEHNIGNNRVLREYENYAGIIGTHAQILSFGPYIVHTSLHRPTCVKRYSWNLVATALQSVAMIYKSWISSQALRQHLFQRQLSVMLQYNHFNISLKNNVRIIGKKFGNNQSKSRNQGIE